MLVLTRRIGESLILGKDSDVTLTILCIKGSKVRLGINAPKKISIRRQK